MKKIRFILIMMLTYILGIGTVSALGISVDDVITEIKKGDMYALLNTNGAIGIEKTSTGFTISTLSEGTTYYSIFNEANGIITYRLDTTLPTETLILQASYDAVWAGEIVSAIVILNGYSREFLMNIEETALTFEKNGIEFTTWKYSLDEENSSFSMTAIETMKIDMNNLRLEDTGSNEPTTPPSNPNPTPDISTGGNKVPALVLSNVGTNSITVNISNTDAGATCRIYRAKDNDAFALLSTVPCSENYVDTAVEANTSYSYRVDTGNNLMSEVATVKTAQKASSGTVHNPNTGIVTHGLLIVLIGVAGAFGLNILRKKDIFKRI